MAPNDQFPCSLYAPPRIGDSELLTSCRVIDVPLPTYRLASAALRALQVDAELSPFVQRTFSLASRDTVTQESNEQVSNLQPPGANVQQDGHKTILRTEYKATTNRMLRVAVNGFMESLGVVLGVMEELDVDVLDTTR
jgi:EKC/KEOPS complex subunit PCC1/LAGE3